MRLPTYCSAQDGETLYSLLARTRDASAVTDDRTVLRLLCGSSTATPMLDIPVRLRASFDAFGSAAGYVSVQDMLNRATLFPYYRPFFSPDRWARVLEIAMGSGGGALKVYMGLAANRVRASSLRSCLTCDIETWREVGAVYWHRRHQLPGVTVCVKHLCELREIDLRAECASRMRLRSARIPSAGGGEGNIFPIDPIALEFSRLALACMDMPPGILSPERAVYIYRELCKQEGLIRGEKHVDWTALILRVATTTCSLRNDLGSRITLSPIHWLATLLRGRRDRQVHPVFHLILALSVCGSAASAVARLRAVASSLEGTDVDLELKGNCSPSKSLKTDQVVPASARRPKALYEPVRRRIVDALRTGEEVQSVAAREKFSIFTVYRVLRETSGLHAKFLEARAKNSLALHRGNWLGLLAEGRSRTQVRKVAPALYAWLYRNDRTWLKLQDQPMRRGSFQRRTIDWPARDFKLAEFVNSSVPLGTPKFIVFRRLTDSPCPISEASARTNANRLPLLWSAISLRCTKIAKVDGVQ